MVAAWAWRSPRASCRPRANRPSTCADDEMEIGIGIHGEPGRKRMKVKEADEIAEMLAWASSRMARTPALSGSGMKPKAIGLILN